MVDHDYVLCGTVDQVKAKIESLATCHGGGELEWFGWSMGAGVSCPLDQAQRQIELFLQPYNAGVQGVATGVGDVGRWATRAFATQNLVITTFLRLSSEHGDFGMNTEWAYGRIWGAIWYN